MISVSRALTGAAAEVEAAALDTAVSRFLMRTLAKVPRAITRSLPRRGAVGVVEIATLHALGAQELAGGGGGLRWHRPKEMWSVVTLSPKKIPSRRAFTISVISPLRPSKPSKKGGRWI